MMSEKTVSIGLIGQRKSGLTGLVRSLLAGNREPGVSLFADKWHITHFTSPSLRSGELEVEQQRALLTYFAPDEPADDGGLLRPRAHQRDPGITHFAITPVSGWRRRKGPTIDSSRARAIEILDTSAALNYEARRGLAGWVSHACHAAPYVVMCHPILPQPGLQESYKPIFGQLRHRFSESAGDSGVCPLHTLVVAFTHYEKMFVARSRDAMRQALDQDIARSHLQLSLRLCPELAEELAALGDIADLRIIGIPVSTYGFVRGDGRSNLDLWLWDDEPISGERAPARILTRPDIYCRLLGDAHRAAGPVVGGPEPTRIDWLLRHWQPFLTADPFIASVCDEKHDLTFSLSDLLQRARGTKAA